MIEESVVPRYAKLNLAAKIPGVHIAAVDR
jgi:hypothetical protein